LWLLACLSMELSIWNSSIHLEGNRSRMYCDMVH
jgi:hypothetical protein